MDLVARGRDDRDIEEDRLGTLAQDREEGNEGEAQQGAAAQRRIRLLLDVLIPGLVGGFVDHPVGDPDEHDDREERGEALEEFLVRARQGSDVAEEDGQTDGQGEGERHATPDDRGLVLVTGLGQVGQDCGDDEDRLHALTQDHEEGGQELREPRGGARILSGLAGVAVEAVGVLADVIRQRREVLVDRRRIIIGHGLLEERELHFDLGDARTGDAAHNLLLHTGDLVVLVVGLVDLVLTGLGVTALVGVGPIIKDAVDSLGNLAPRAGAVVVRRGLGGRTGGYTVQGRGVFNDVLLEGRGMTVDARAITVRHGLLEERELHFDLRDTRTGDAGHDLLLHAGDLVVLVVGVVDLVLAALSVAPLKGGHAFVDEAVDRRRDVAPRLVGRARRHSDNRHDESRHDQGNEKTNRPLDNMICASTKHCHRLPPEGPA